MRLTKPQQLIYDMERFSGGAIATICGSVLLKGHVEGEEISDALNRMVECNDALRLQITEKDGVPSQTVAEYTPQEFPVLWFLNKDALQEYADKLAQEPMELHGELFRAVGIVVGEEYGILVKIHHIISDAWTLTLIASQFYALMNGEEINPRSYMEYIATEDNYLASERYQKDRQFWLDTFAKCDEPAYLSEHMTKSTRANRKTFVIDREQTAVIADYVHKTGTSMYSVMMTAVAVYFNRVNNNLERFYIGTAVLNRSGKAEKNTVGMFINTVPVLIQLDNEKTFEENMAAIVSASFHVFRHQRYNYGDILKSIREEYKFEEKLYDVIFSYQNARISGADVESAWYHCGAQNESLQIHIDDWDSEGILKVHYDYNTEKFTEVAIESMHRHIFNLLLDAIENYVSEDSVQ